MEKVFENLKELMDFDFSTLTASKSNYITILANNGLPKVRRSQNFSKWRVITKRKGDIEPRILMELTPKWITITVHQGKALKSRIIDIPCFRKDPKIIIQEIFEF